MATARRTGRFGLAAPEGPVDFAAVMSHVRQPIATIAPDDSGETMTAARVEVVTALDASSDLTGSWWTAARSSSSRP